MDPDLQAIIVKAVWLIMGLIMGYAVGVARTSLGLMRKMQKELHECHVALHRKEGQKDA